MVEDRTRRAPGGWAADFAAATAVGAFLGLLGPFGSFLNGPLWQRLAYWIVMAWLGLATYGLLLRPLLRRLPAGRPAWAAVTIYALLMCAPVGFVSWSLAHAIWPRLSQVPNLTPLVWYLECLIITAPQVALFAWRRTRRPAGRAGAPTPAASLLAVLPAEVLCLQMEDHYVRVHTARGSRLVLATMGQAVAALGGARGVRTHRSWWVADKAVAGVLADGRKLRLTLTNGVTAPVARTAVAAVREAGWLQRTADGADQARAVAGG